jgi:hypothetical protein
MNAGTALHEQKGVATPSKAAPTLANPSRRPPRSWRVRSTDRNERRTVTAKMIAVSSSRIFAVSNTKNRIVSPSRLDASRPIGWNRSQFQNGPFPLYSTNQTSAAPATSHHVREAGSAPRRGSASVRTLATADGEPNELHGEFLQGDRADPVVDASPTLGPLDEPGLAKDPQVIGEQVRRHAEARSELAYARGPSLERPQDREPCRVRERGERWSRLRYPRAGPFKKT